MNRRWPFVNGRIRGWARTYLLRERIDLETETEIDKALN